MVAWSSGRAFDAPVWRIKSLELGSAEDHAEIVFRSRISVQLVHCRTIRHPTIEEHLARLLTIFPAKPAAFLPTAASCRSTPKRP
jgi:hypothetical protein